MYSGRRWLLPLWVLLASTSCDRRSAPGAAFQEHDSAGITILEYPRSALAAAPRWTVEPTPAVSIGLSAEGDPAYDLFRVRGVAALSTGELVILNGGTREIRVYDADGRHVRTIGREGAGPGEFSGLTWLLVTTGDSMLVFDNQLQRLTVLDPDGNVARLVTMGSLDIGTNAALGPLEDGSLLIAKDIDLTFPPPEGLQRDTVTYRRISTTGDELPAFGAYPGTEMFSTVTRERMLVEPVGFGIAFQLVAGDSLIYLGTTDRYQVQVRSHDNELRRLIRVSALNTTVTRDMIDAYKNHHLAGFGDSAISALARRGREAMPYPATVPEFSRLAVDSDQNLWVRDYPAYPDSNPDWHVFDAAGRLLAAIRLPEEFEEKVIRRDRIIGITTADDGIERVLVYMFVRDDET